MMSRDADVVGVLRRLTEAVDTVVGVHDHESLGPQTHGERGGEPGFVFHDQDLHPCHPPPVGQQYPVSFVATG